MKIVKSRHYKLYHEGDFPWDEVVEVILTTKKQRIGKSLFRFVRRSKRREVYILARYDSEKDELKVINAKRRRR